MPAPDPSDEALAAAEELLADDNAPVLANGEHSWLKHNIARLCDFFAAERVAESYQREQPHQKLGDAPVQAEYRAKMEAVTGRCNYMSNGADRRDIVTLMKEMIARFEGQPGIEGFANAFKAFVELARAHPDNDEAA